MNFTNDFFFQGKLLCPIPEDQKPIQEYLEVKENSLINWTGFSFLEYKSKIAFLYIFSFFLFFFFQLTIQIDNRILFNFNLTLAKIIAKILIEGLENSFFLSILVLLLLLNRWKELGERFYVSQLFYEESSWFDGQLWAKAFFILKNDRLLFTKKIIPILKRIYKSVLFFLFLALIGFFINLIF
jgi:hypothetical protein